MSRSRLLLSCVLFGAVLLSLALPYATADAGSCTYSVEPYQHTSIDWDFNLDSHGFTTASCGGAPVWQWGLETQQTALLGMSPVRCWSTVLNGNYPNNAGQGLLSPPFLVTPSRRFAVVELFYEAEWGGAPWLGGNPDTTGDGFNVKINGVLVKPCNTAPPGDPDQYPQEPAMVGGVISATGLHTTRCVDGQPGVSGCEDSPGGCSMGMVFKLEPFMGQTVQLRIDFGSDEANNYMGVIVTRILIGGAPVQSTDLSIVPQDITLTDGPGGSVQVAATVRNLGMTASNIAVRFRSIDPGGAVQSVSLGPDQNIASLAEGESAQLQAVWYPGSDQDQVHVIVDPANTIAEGDEVNNTARKSFRGSPPAIVGLEAQWDGNDSPDVVGTFMSGIAGSNNTFTAYATDPDNDIVRVEFTLGANTIVDNTPGDGWKATFDMGALGSADVPLAVVAIDANDAHSPIKIVTIDMEAMPGWMLTKLSFEGHPVSFEGGFIKIGFKFKPDGQNTNLLNYFYPFDSEMFLLGGKKNKFEGTVEGDIAIPLNRNNAGPRISAKIKLKQEYFDRPVERELALTLTLNPDYSLATIAFQWQAEARLITFGPYERPVPIVGPIVGILGIGLDLYGRLGTGIEAAASLDNFKITLTAGLSPQFNATLGVSLAGIATLRAVISPRLNCDHAIQFEPPAPITGMTSGTWEVRWQLQGCVIFGGCEPLAEGAWGPYTLFDPFAPGLTAGSSTLADPFAAMDPQALVHPDLRSGPDNRLGMVWIRDVDPSPSRVDPEVMFAHADSAGIWSEAIPVTGPTGPDPYFQLDPALAFEPGGAAVATWIQNRLTEPMALADPPPVATALANQDIFFSRWNGAAWSAPAPVVEDASGALRADGPPAVSVAPSGEGMLLWTRCLTGQSLDQGNREIHYATYDSTSLFSSPVQLTSDSRDDYDPAVASGGGRAMGVWLKDVPGGVLGASDNEVVSAVWNGAAWSPAATIAGGGHIHRDPSVAMLANGDAVACWTTVEILPDSQSVQTVEASTWDHSMGLWSAPEAVHTSLQIESPQVNVDARQIAVITWRGHDGFDGDLFASMKDLDDPLSEWTVPDTLTQDDLTDWMLASTVDEQNNLHFVDLKTDLSDLGAVANTGDFFDGLALGSRAIGADLTFEDELNFGFVALAADLKSAGPIQPSAPWPILGQPDTLRLAVTNIGATVSAASIVRFTVGHPDSGGTLFAERPFAQLYPGDTTTVVAIWTPQAGSHTLWASIDPLNAVVEQTESNNRTPVTLSTVPNPSALAVWTDPASPLPGAVTIRGAVANPGGLDAASVRVHLLVGAQTVLDTTLAGLARNETDTVAVVATMPSGVSPLRVVVDSLGALFESDESDNIATGEARILPDLEILAHSLALGAVDASTSRWSAVLHNTGGVATGPVTVTFWAGHPLGAGERLGHTVVSSLGARDSVPVHVDTAPRPGITTLYVMADSADVIVERSESNNNADRAVNVMPDLKLASADITVNGSNSPFDIAPTIHNIGSADAVGVTAWFFEGHPDSGGVLLGGRTLPDLGAGASQQAHFELTLEDNAPRWLYVQVDRNAAVAEQREWNNIAGIHFDPDAYGPQVVISQVYGGGGSAGSTYKNDFIELFNRGTTSANLAGWSVQYAAATGTTWSVTQLSGTLPSGGYLLIQQAGGSIGAALPTPDFAGAINMNGGGGKVALVSATTPLSGTCPSVVFIEDLVGYGTTASCWEGSGRAPGGNNSLAVKRLQSGCSDTDNNASDFAAGTPTARNSASPRNNCLPTNPSGVGAAAPTSVPQGAQVLLTVTATPGAGPPSTGLAAVVNLMSIGGSASAAMYDDGTHGDVTAADLTFSLLATVAGSTSPGAKTVPFTLTDAQSRTGSGSIGFQVTASAQGPLGERVEFGIRSVGPNPAPGTLTVHLGLPSAAPVKLELFDIAGRRAFKREIGSLGPGLHRVALSEAASLQSGIYLLRVTQAGKVASRRVALVH